MLHVLNDTEYFWDATVAVLIKSHSDYCSDFILTVWLRHIPNLDVWLLVERWNQDNIFLKSFHSRSWQPPWIISPYIGALIHGDCYLKFYPFSRWDGRLGKNKPLNILFWLITFKRLTLEEKVMEQNIFKKYISNHK